MLDASAASAPVGGVPRHRRRRRRLLLAGAIAVALAAPFLLFGWTSVVTPPRDPGNPTRVFVLRDALHVGIVLPAANAPGGPDGRGRWLEYGFGDWGSTRSGTPSGTGRPRPCSGRRPAG